MLGLVLSHWWNTTYLPKWIEESQEQEDITHTFRHTCLNKMKQNGAEEGRNGICRSPTQI